MKNIIVTSWQIITYFLVGAPLRLLFRVKRSINFKIEKGKKYIIAANHPARIDPFLISYSLPFKEFIKLVPLRFITADEYLTNPLLRYFLLLYGCFTTKKQKNKTVLELSIELLERGETVFIFPSGRLEQNEYKIEPKIGVAYLEREVKDSLILPVKISYNERFRFINLLTRKIEVQIEFKESFRHTEFPKDLQLLADNVYHRITKKEIIKKFDLHKLNWTIKDNPNGWIEPTTYCQLKCPGCYRGLAEENPQRIHEELENLKTQVDWFIKNRNTQTISIAGGEPLMYPKLNTLIEYISNKGLKTKIYTNGIALNQKRLTKLKEAGVTEVIVHIDKYQRNNSSENEMNRLREKYCNLFRKIGGVNLGFIMPLSKQNLDDLEVLSKFFQRNSDIINLVVFTVYKEMLPEKKISNQLKINMEGVSSAVKKSFGLSYCAYLGKERSDNVSWLFSLSSYGKGEFLGSFDKEFYRKIQERYYGKKNKHFITIKNRAVSLWRLFLWSTNSSVRKVLLNTLKTGVSSINTQVVLIIDAPEQIGGKWDLCDGCPDAMLFEDKLIPSCLLERIKADENILIH